jgi:hypothetical protein
MPLYMDIHSFHDGMASQDSCCPPGETGGLSGLVAQGLTYRQTGERLFIAERTVDTHVGRILAKLGCARRSQVAAIVAGCSNPPAPEHATRPRCTFLGSIASVPGVATPPSERGA